MKLRRVYELTRDVLALPVIVGVCTAAGFFMSFVVWWGRVKLTWSMRDSTYVWEKE